MDKTSLLICRYVGEVNNNFNRIFQFSPILDGVRAHPILDGGGKKPPVLTLPFSV